jgi:hypothetical protein
MNPINILRNYVSQGLSPEKIVTKLAGNNPMMQNLIKMQKKGDTKGVENFARNFCKEKNINIDDELNKFKQLLK